MEAPVMWISYATCTKRYGHYLVNKINFLRIGLYLNSSVFRVNTSLTRHLEGIQTRFDIRSLYSHACIYARIREMS